MAVTRRQYGTGTVLEDGLYRVNRWGICAGLVIEHGRLIDCAPILRKRLTLWLAIAERVGPA